MTNICVTMWKILTYIIMYDAIDNIKVTLPASPFEGMINKSSDTNSYFSNPEINKVTPSLNRGFKNVIMPGNRYDVDNILRLY